MLNRDVNNTALGNPKRSLELIIEGMKEKSKILSESKISNEREARELLKLFFHIRRHIDNVLRESGIERIRRGFEILKSDMSYSKKVSLFVAEVRGANVMDVEDVAKEALHFLEPKKYPLWNRWIWNKERNSGSITYVLKDGIRLKDYEEFFNAVNELKLILDKFGLNSEDYYYTSIFLVYSYVRYMDYVTLLAVDRKGAGVLPTHLTTTAMVLGVKDLIKVRANAYT